MPRLPQQELTTNKNLTNSHQLSASVTFSVPSQVKHLEVEQLAVLTESFRAWYLGAPLPAYRRARGRMWLTYLAIRFTGAKLGEVLAIDDQADLDAEQGTLRLGARSSGEPGREIQLPPDVIAEVQSYLGDPANGSMRGKVFQLDQGFVRRKLYERADACGIPRDLVSPQVLRASRALELLRGGVPLPVVQRLLGQTTANLTASYVDYEPGDVGRIFEAYLLSELRARTSARNLFAGQVSRIVRGEILSEVTMETPDGHQIVSVITNTSLENLGIKKASPVTALIKAPSVMISKGNIVPQISARNILPGQLKTVRDDGVVAEVIVEISGFTDVCALITADSVGRLDLTAGDAVHVAFDTSAVVLSVAMIEQMLDARAARSAQS